MPNKYDEESFVREIQHKHLVSNQSNKKEVTMSWSEARANEEMAATAKQDRIDARQRAAKQANEAARQRNRENMQGFWSRVIQIAIFLIAMAVVFKIYGYLG